jgi:small subunit ribosomal protein S4
MAIDRVPALKRCRALGLEPAFIGRSKQSNRQPKRAGKKMSEYGIQLREKQKAKFIYGVLEKQFRKYYVKAKTMSGITGESLLILLERRADNIVFRMGLAATRRQARQIVSHGHILVNGKKMNIPSALLKAGDVVTIKEKSRGTALFKDMAETATALDVPAWISFDAQNLAGTI